MCAISSKKRYDSDGSKSLASLKQALKSGDFSHIYLLFGEEEYLVSHYEKKLTERILGGDELNTVFLNGETCTKEEVIDGAMTLPFLSDKRLIVVRDSGWFKTADSESAESAAAKSKDPLVELFSNIPETAYIIFSERGVDKRNAIYKACSKYGTAVEFKEQSVNDLTGWIARRLKAKGKAIRKSTVEKILDYCGTDMNRLSNELDKLVSYTADREAIEDDDVAAVCSRDISAYIFDMTDAIINGQKERAFALYFDLLSNKEEPIKIIINIGQQFARLCEVAFCLEDGMNPDQTADELNIQPWLAKKLMRKAGRAGHARYLRGIELSLSAFEDIVSGRVSDSLACEMLIAEA